MIDTQALRKKILDIAVRGDLCTKNENLSTVYDLLMQISEKKEELIKSKALKREQQLPIISETEIPYELPDHWQWVRLGDYAEKVTDYVASGSFQSLRENAPSLKTKNYAILVKTADFSNGFTKNLTYTTEHGYHFLENSNLFGGELILSNIGSIGKVFIVPKLNKKMTLAPNSVMIRLTEESLRDYLYYFLLSPVGYRALDMISSGTAVKKFNKTSLKTILLPIPPVEEQKKIVGKIQKLFFQLDVIDDLQQQYADNITSLNKKILDLAIMGKLVPQDPSDEPASVLLQKIAEEKQKLIKEGKISKSKTRYDFEDSDTPFVVPDTWGWARLGDICFDLKYGTSSKSSKTGEMIVIRMGNIQNGEIDYSDLVYSSNEADNEKYALKPLDILFNRTNSNELVGKTGIYRGQHKAIFAGYLVLIRPIGMNPEYLNYVMNSEYEKAYCIAVKSDSVNQANVNATKIGQFLIPIPPRKEQDRIVKMIKNTLNEIRNSNYSPQKSEWERIRK